MENRNSFIDQFVINPNAKITINSHLFRGLIKMTEDLVRKEMKYETDVKHTIYDKEGKAVKKALTKKQKESGDYEKRIDIIKTLNSKPTLKITDEGLSYAAVNLELEKIFKDLLEAGDATHYSELQNPVNEENTTQEHLDKTKSIEEE